jgi:hypothetical protein
VGVVDSMAVFLYWLNLNYGLSVEILTSFRLLQAGHLEAAI